MVQEVEKLSQRSEAAHAIKGRQSHLEILKKRCIKVIWNGGGRVCLNCHLRLVVRVFVDERKGSKELGSCVLVRMSLQSKYAVPMIYSVFMGKIERERERERERDAYLDGQRLVD